MKLKDHKEIRFDFNSVEFYSPGMKLKSVDLNGFKLEKIEDCRKKKENLRSRALMLRSANGTYAYIYAPDVVLNELLLKLPHYIDKHWCDIENIEIKNIHKDSGS